MAESPPFPASDVDGDLRIPPEASDDEAAAIAAAIGAHLRQVEYDATDTEDSVPPWTGRRWGFAGRMQDLQGRAVRVARGAPSSGWAAASRTDRMR